MQRMTYREFVTWQEYLRGQWNRPNRTDHYLMAVAAETRRGWVKEPQRVRHNEFELEFSFKPVQPPVELTPEEELARSKAVWLAIAGLT